MGCDCDIDGTGDTEDGVEREDLQQRLVAKCKEIGIEAKIKKYPDRGTYVVAEMPNGREKRRVAFLSDEVIERALDLGFEKYVFLADYVAIACYENCVIEALIRPLAGFPAHPSEYMARCMASILSVKTA